MGVLPDWMIERDVSITPFEQQQSRPGKISYGVSSYGYDFRAGYRFKLFKPTWQNSVIDPKNFPQDAFDEINLTPNHGLFRDGADKKSVVCGLCGDSRPYNTGWPGYCPKAPYPDHIVLPPHSFCLTESYETIRIPRDVMCICLGKSTLARCGIIVNVTPLEPEWEGTITIEISNTAPLPAKIYAGEGILQGVFLRSDGRSEAVELALMAFFGGQPFGERDRLVEALRQSTCRTSYADKKGKYQNQRGIELPKVDGSASGDK